MQYIIVTADDYGMCQDVDTAIDAAIQAGMVSTTNVLVNMETLANAVDIRERFPQISIGIHWNVTTGSPVCRPEEVSTLVDSAGHFYPLKIFKKRFAKGKITREDLKRELIAQVKLFEQYCGKPDYWNTHENSSLSISAFSVFAEVAKQFDIPATRNFKRVYYDKTGLSFKRELREFFVSRFFNLWFDYIRKDFKMPSARVVSFNRISKTQGEILSNAIVKDGRNLIEVIFHPAIASDHPAFGNISEERVNEYHYLTSADTKREFEEKNLQIVNFDFL